MKPHLHCCVSEFAIVENRNDAWPAAGTFITFELVTFVEASEEHKRRYSKHHIHVVNNFLSFNLIADPFRYID